MKRAGIDVIIHEDGRYRTNAEEIVKILMIVNDVVTYYIKGEGFFRRKSIEDFYKLVVEELELIDLRDKEIAQLKVKLKTAETKAAEHGNYFEEVNKQYNRLLNILEMKCKVCPVAICDDMLTCKQDLVNFLADDDNFNSEEELNERKKDKATKRDQ